MPNNHSCLIIRATEENQMPWNDSRQRLLFTQMPIGIKVSFQYCICLLFFEWNVPCNSSSSCWQPSDVDRKRAGLICLIYMNQFLLNFHASYSFKIQHTPKEPKFQVNYPGSQLWSKRKPACGRAAVSLQNVARPWERKPLRAQPVSINRKVQANKLVGAALSSRLMVVVFNPNL